MADITQHTQLPTIREIYDKYVKRREPPHRLHLGGSQIGHSCNRYLWYQFRWADHEIFDGRMLRLFDHGEWEEKRLIKDLRDIGITVYDVDPETGRQWHFSAFGGHFGLSLDGVGQGFSESQKWHSLEFKTFNEKQFAQLKKHGMEKHKPQHYAQVQAGMELGDIPRVFYLAVNKNTDELYGERVHRKHKEGERLLKRAERVIFSEEPLEKISQSPDWYECKFCTMYKLCHQGGTAEVNCRTCLHSTAERDGTWSCAKFGKTLDEATQRAGCQSHLLRPHLTGHGEAVDAGDDFVEYENKSGQRFRNGPPGPGSYTSHEMRAAEALPGDEIVEQMRTDFDARIVEE